MLFQLNSQLQDYYSRNYTTIIHQVSQGDYGSYASIIQKWRRFAPALFSQKQYLEEVAAIKMLVEERVRFKKCKVHNLLATSSVLPVPKQFIFFEQKLAQDKYFDFILNYKPLETYKTYLYEILEKKMVVTASVPLRSVSMYQQCFIVGNIEYTLLGLANVSHEVGHCLFESLFATTKWTHQIFSEIAAGVLEKNILKAYLTAYGKSKEVIKWNLYQETIDYLNLYFFLLEYRVINNRAVHLEKEFFKKNVILRESFFTLPGYQICYAYATLFKRNQLKLINYSLLQNNKNEWQFLSNIAT